MRCTYGSVESRSWMRVLEAEVVSGKGLKSRDIDEKDRRFQDDGGKRGVGGSVLVCSKAGAP